MPFYKRNLANQNWLWFLLTIFYLMSFCPIFWIVMGFTKDVSVYIAMSVLNFGWSWNASGAIQNRLAWCKEESLKYINSDKFKENNYKVPNLLFVLVNFWIKDYNYFLRPDVLPRCCNDT